MVFIIMGVSGSGKTTVGKMLAERISGKFFDADSLHSKENVDKMSRGIPLTDADREPWLRSVRDLIDSQSGTAVIACSALKKSYRDLLKTAHKTIVFIYLKGDKHTLEDRLEHREGHFAGADLLESQLETLEEPEDALTFDITETAELIVNHIVTKLGL